jgi:hypothetical protein
MSTFTFRLTLLPLATTGAAQSDNPTFWLLIGRSARLPFGWYRSKRGLSPKSGV